MDEETTQAKLTPKQRKFIDEYLTDFNASRAARAAGYSEKTAYAMGWENLRKPEIKAEIDRRLDEVRMSKPEVLKRLSDIASGDMGDFIDERLSIDLSHAIETGKTRLIRKIRQRTTTKIGRKQDDDDVEITDTEIELYNAQTALEVIGKHHGIFVDKVEHSGTLTIERLTGVDTDKI